MPRISRTILLPALLSSLMAAAPAWAGPAPAGKAPAAQGRPVPTWLEAIGIPHYVAPASYSEDLVFTAEGKMITMRRFVDHEKIRTEISVGEQEVVTLEAGDADGTMYTLAASQKKAMKSSRKGMEAMARENEKSEQAGGEEPADFNVEVLGDDTIDGVPVKKIRMTAAGRGTSWPGSTRRPARRFGWKRRRTARRA